MAEATLRSPATARAALALYLLVPTWGIAAEGEWNLGRAAAARQAQRQGKLLMIVHVSGDFAANDPESREAKIYRRLALADPRITELLARRYVVSLQNIGEAQSLRRLPPAKKDKDEAAPPREYAICYMCLPDETVLHFIPGFVSGNELLVGLSLAERCYADLLSAEPAEQERAVRRFHQAATSAAERAVFERLFESRWKDDTLPSGTSTVDLPAALKAAQETLATSLKTRVGAGWSKKDSPALLAALATHGAVAGDISHFLLGEFPLVALSDLEKPAIECYFGERFWGASARRESLTEWCRHARSESKPLLFVLPDDQLASERRAQAPLVWPPADTRFLPHLDQFASELVSLDEMAALVHDVELPHVTYAHTALPPRYVLFDKDGKLAAQLPRTATYSRLAQAMLAIVDPGVLVAPLAQAGGTSDEED